ncbi:hypothetical protein C8T65DRAFT_280602 [Cerioporus squamosus]|nr:hypothetical protein C8T65DRAFT_280602 [Cerioporus squamosus]
MEYQRAYNMEIEHRDGGHREMVPCQILRASPAEDVGSCSDEPQGPLTIGHWHVIPLRSSPALKPWVRVSPTLYSGAALKQHPSAILPTTVPARSRRNSLTGD